MPARNVDYAVLLSDIGSEGKGKHRFDIGKRGAIKTRVEQLPAERVVGKLEADIVRSREFAERNAQRCIAEVENTGSPCKEIVIAERVAAQSAFGNSATLPSGNDLRNAAGGIGHAYAAFGHRYGNAIGTLVYLELGAEYGHAHITGKYAERAQRIVCHLEIGFALQMHKALVGSNTVH